MIVDSIVVLKVKEVLLLLFLKRKRKKGKSELYNDEYYYYNNSNSFSLFATFYVNQYIYCNSILVPAAAI
jgi:CTP:phosphocholine cytidylyltransferase-like protein